jgi:hypothetical protein
MQRKKWSGWDLNTMYSSFHGCPTTESYLLAEVVGSTPTLSILYYEGTTALTTLVLGNRRTRLINKRHPMSMKGYL